MARGTDPAQGELRRPRGLLDLFLAFTGLALQGFGGVLPVAQRGLCERRRWLRNAEFLEHLAVGQALPGPNVCNLAIMVGHRFFGWRGALAALAGLMAAPLAIVLSLAAVHDHLAARPEVAGAVRGMSAVSCGLLAGTALKLVGALRRTALGPVVAAALGGGAFVMVALARLPLVWAVAGLGMPAWAYAALRLRSQAAPRSRA
jgi:chromate transporter